MEIANLRIRDHSGSDRGGEEETRENLGERGRELSAKSEKWGGEKGLETFRVSRPLKRHCFFLKRNNVVFIK